MRSITAVVVLCLLGADWWDQAYNHGAYARALVSLIANIRHGFGI